MSDLTFDASHDVKVELSDEVTQCNQNENNYIDESYDSPHIEACNTSALSDSQQMKTMDLNDENVEDGSPVDAVENGYGQSASGVVKVETDEMDLHIASDVSHAEDNPSKVEDVVGLESDLLGDDESENLFPTDALCCVQPDCGKALSLLLVGYHCLPVVYRRLFVYCCCCCRAFSKHCETEIPEDFPSMGGFQHNKNRE